MSDKETEEGEEGEMPPDFSEYQAFIKSVEADLNKKFGDIGYACFVFRKESLFLGDGIDSYSTLISNAASYDRVIEIITPYVMDSLRKKNIEAAKKQVVKSKKLRRIK